MIEQDSDHAKERAQANKACATLNTLDAGSMGN
jgi:hypothetical protein